MPRSVLERHGPIPWLSYVRDDRRDDAGKRSGVGWSEGGGPTCETAHRQPQPVGHCQPQTTVSISLPIAPSPVVSLRVEKVASGDLTGNVGDESLP